jgi:hypothetical protein
MRRLIGGSQKYCEGKASAVCENRGLKSCLKECPEKRDGKMSTKVFDNSQSLGCTSRREFPSRSENLLDGNASRENESITPRIRSCDKMLNNSDPVNSRPHPHPETPGIIIAGVLHHMSRSSSHSRNRIGRQNYSAILLIRG